MVCAFIFSSAEGGFERRGKASDEEEARPINADDRLAVACRHWRSLLFERKERIRRRDKAPDVENGLRIIKETMSLE